MSAQGNALGVTVKYQPKSPNGAALNDWDLPGSMSERSNAKFELGEFWFFGGEYSWRLKDGELRYRGTESFKDLIIGRIPVTANRVQKFASALDLLAVWSWRDDYDPQDLGHVCMDGGYWWFKAEINGRSIRARGANSYPSYEDARLTSCDEERFGLLKTALYEAFTIDGFIEMARRQAERAKQIESERESKPTD